jgi:hypothetical protein
MLTTIHSIVSPFLLYSLPCENIPQKAEDPVSNCHLARLLLSHFGFLSPQNRHNFHLVEDNTRWRRALADLDKVRGYDSHSLSFLFSFSSFYASCYLILDNFIISFVFDSL